MNSLLPTKAPRLVVVESPFAGDVAANIDYARAAVRDSLMRGEAPIASHLLHTQRGILRDDVPEERSLGIAAGHAWIPASSLVAVYLDRGMSSGMRAGIQAALDAGVELDYRYIEPPKLRVAS
ncbi:hypothetical protein [Pseudoclavibacter sp. VKM Ac-2888]|uniref:DUF7768 domain-containing protein n=1 Tax=Pseudoclavibacter sp. VKM Ac-2888 TaxID=2783830 RepID=UPI00188C3FDE|nr:hypothetical protein [Pseudoclavibacter sp. VKM Ac-2888]MBF4549699.1 hypothetical protein [Pseudoclavibacter sp. VKM Ac-2888]